MIFSWNKYPLVILVTILLLGGGVLASAQVAENISSYDSSVNEGDFEFEINPTNPGPHQKVTVKLSSNLVDTNRYRITWTVDGSVIASGIGTRTITVETKDYGQTTAISMSIVLVESTITKKVSLTPQDTTMLWEAVDSYVPPFYEGKRLPSFESLVRIISIPNFLQDKKSSATKNAVYVWKRNENVVSSASGYGRDSILIEHNRVRKVETLSVTSSSTDATSQAITSITVPFFDPFVLMYTRNRTTGIRNIAPRSTVSVPTEGILVEIEPYFFSVVQNNPNFLKISLRMNNEPIVLDNANKKTVFSLTNPGQGGAATLEASVESPTKLFQSATASLRALLN